MLFSVCAVFSFAACFGLRTCSTVGRATLTLQMSAVDKDDDDRDDGPDEVVESPDIHVTPIVKLTKVGKHVLYHWLGALCVLLHAGVIVMYCLFLTGACID